MKQTLIILFFWTVFASCSQERKDHHITPSDSTRIVETVQNSSAKDSVTALGSKVLKALKRNDYTQFSQFFSSAGVYFSPYGFLDTTHCKHLNAADFLTAIQKNWTLTWGSYDGTGEPIRLTTTDFIKKFVYNADYLQAHHLSYNEVFQKGNSLVNLSDIFPNHPFIDYHFAGFDKKYAGMDWTSLILVFGKEDNRYVLVGVIHHQWTI